MASSITPERFAQGMTFDQYIAYLGSPENLAREPATETPPTGWRWAGAFRTPLAAPR